MCLGCFLRTHAGYGVQVYCEEAVVETWAVLTATAMFGGAATTGTMSGSIRRA